MVLRVAVQIGSPGLEGLCPSPQEGGHLVSDREVCLRGMRRRGTRDVPLVERLEELVDGGHQLRVRRLCPHGRAYAQAQAHHRAESQIPHWFVSSTSSDYQSRSTDSLGGRERREFTKWRAGLEAKRSPFVAEYRHRSTVL